MCLLKEFLQKTSGTITQCPAWQGEGEVVIPKGRGGRRRGNETSLQRSCSGRGKRMAWQQCLFSYHGWSPAAAQGGSFVSQGKAN